jgi:hypothetical protein
MVVGAMTPECQARHFKDWEDSGFNRRFLWPLITLDDPEVLERAVEEWTLLELGQADFPALPQGEIPNTTTREERQALRVLVKYQPGGSHATQLAILVKMLAVLRWWYKARGLPVTKALDRMREFARSLSKTGARLTVPAPWYVGAKAAPRNGTRPRPKRKTHRCPRCNRLHPGNCRPKAGNIPRARTKGKR